MNVRSARPLVVCVDDEPAVLASLRRSLRNESYDVLTTDHPEDALEWAGTRKVNVVISDQRMPRMTGVEFLAALRSRSPGTAGIMLTGYDDSALEVGRAGLKIECLILKPWNDLVLRGTIRRILKRRNDGSGASEAAPEGRAPVGPGPGSGPSRRSSGPVAPRRGDWSRTCESRYSAPDAPQVQVRIDCLGMASADVIAQAIRASTKALSSGARPVIVLQNLGLLGDSLSGLLKGLARLAEESGTRMTFYDDSGYGAAFLQVIGGAGPLEVRRGLPG